MKHVITLVTFGCVAFYMVTYTEAVRAVTESPHAQAIVVIGVIFIVFMYSVFIQVIEHMLKSGAYLYFVLAAGIFYLASELHANRFRLERMGAEDWVPFIIVGIPTIYFAWQAIKAGHNRKK